MWSGRRSRSRGPYVRSRNRRPVATLNVSARARKKKSHAAEAALMGRIAAVLVAVIAVCLAVWFGLRGMGSLLYSRSQLYTIKRLEILTDDAKVLDYISGRGIRAGANMFSFNSSDVRADFLRAASNYRSMEIVRILPDTLVISVTPRKPLARLGESSPFVVDGEQLVFGLNDNRTVLPVITGLDTRSLKPGKRMEDQGSRGVAVLDACARTELGRDIVISRIDVSGHFRGRRDAVRLALEDGGEVDLWWPKSRQHYPQLPAALLERLETLRDVILKARALDVRVATVDLTLDSCKDNIAVTYLN